MDENTYYITQKNKMLQGLASYAKPMQPELAVRFGEEEAREMLHDVLDEYAFLIPKFPYIGGRRNPFTTNLVQAGYGLALYRALHKRGGTLEQAGELIHLGIELQLKQIPAFLRRWMALYKYSASSIRKMKERARISHQRRYPGDWVFEVIDGDGQSFDVGMDFSECGIDKFMRKMGAEALTPYLCNTDYVLFGACGMELQRTKALSWGCDCCNFRIKKNGSMPPAWPPQFLERDCGKKRNG